MSALGILHETPDQQYLYGFLERQQDKSIGIVITGAINLLQSAESQSSFVDYMENMVKASANMQIILTAEHPLLETKPNVLVYTLPSITPEDGKLFFEETSKNQASLKSLSHLIKLKDSTDVFSLFHKI